MAFAVSVLVVGSIAGGGPAEYLPGLNWTRLNFDLLTLDSPHAPIFGPHPIVNGALWTIRWEFLCYLLAPMAVWNRVALAGLWVATLMIAVTSDAPQITWLLMFLSGAAYFRFGVSPTTGTLLASGVFLIVSLFTPLWELGLAVAGAPLLLWTGLSPSRPSRLPDISYGTYLYGWPLQKLLILAGVSSPWLLLALSLPLALLAGAASWYCIERHALRLKHRKPVSLTLPTPQTR